MDKNKQEYDRTYVSLFALLFCAYLPAVYAKLFMPFHPFSGNALNNPIEIASFPVWTLFFPWIQGVPRLIFSVVLMLLSILVVIEIARSIQSSFILLILVSSLTLLSSVLLVWLSLVLSSS